MPYFINVKVFCFFVASARSGHSILAHLLSAHPKVMISDELDALSYFKEGYEVDKVYELIKNQDEKFQRRDRKKSGYSYKIDNLWQNVSVKYPEVIGDAKGARATSLLSTDKDFLEDLRQKTGVNIRAIFCLRNPFDVIATKKIRRDTSLDTAIDEYRNNALGMVSAHSQFRDEELMVLYHEELINDPESHFSRLFSYIEVEPLGDVCVLR
jgi:hypothetical protein